MSDRSAWIAENTHIVGKQLSETAGGKPLCKILAFAGTPMLLVDAVIMMPKLVHENMQQHERSRLRLRKSARDAILLAVIRNTERLENLAEGNVRNAD
ncbi:MAG TPA: hypothetical protein VGR78_17635 [Verrucomicrobiae bacterium]|nr:hypothetical protein [Verrucomicrobiae bacterium]